MIDEDRTLQLFGYTGNDVPRFSPLIVVVVCEECGKYRLLQKRSRVWENMYCPDLCASCAHIGTSLKDETKRKISSAVGGAKHPNWKGGISKWRISLSQQPSYKNWRKAVFERDDYTCQMCNVRGGKLEAHHIRPVRDHKNDLFVYDIDNGVTLCKDCHKTIGCEEEEWAEEFKRKVYKVESVT